jgi:hypothetical protein
MLINLLTLAYTWIFLESCILVNNILIIIDKVLLLEEQRWDMIRWFVLLRQNYFYLIFCISCHSCRINLFEFWIVIYSLSYRLVWIHNIWIRGIISFLRFIFIFYTTFFLWHQAFIELRPSDCLNLI